MACAPLVDHKKMTTKTIKKPVEKLNKNTLENSVDSPVETEVIKTPEEVKEIKIIERIIESKEVAPSDAFGKLTKGQIELMKNTVAKGASDDELKLFLQVCKGANLNPFLKQVFLVPRWDSKAGKEIRAIQVSIDGFRAIAEEGGAYAGNEDAVFGADKDLEYESGSEGKKTKKTLKVPDTATVTVYKIVHGGRYPFTATARWDEYYPGSKMGFQWHQRPYLMLGKCAEALALRKAFPKLLSGMYAQEELEKGQTPMSEAQRVDSGFKKLMSMIATASIAELKEYKAKIEKSDKYTEDQKVEFCMSVEDRIKQG